MSDLLPDSYYDWVFVAGSGDRYGGFLYADSGTYAPGQVLPTPYGYYRIGAERPYGYDLGPFESTVYVTSYFDAVQGPLQTGNYPYYSAPSSVTGLGQEYDYAWNGAFWDDFGLGGAAQAGYYG